MNIAIYARVSTDKQETENQLLQLRDFAAKQGWQSSANTETTNPAQRVIVPSFSGCLPMPAGQV